jgi:methyltransferase
VSWPALIVGLVALERLAELIYAQRNTRALLREGAHEIGRNHYPLIVLLHLSWLIAVYAFADKSAPPTWGWIAVFVLLQAARYWILATLGRYWTTRIIVVPNAPLIAGGPYRFLRHPNYAVVIAEIAVLPLAFGEYAIALVFTVLNATLLAWRIRIENAALNARSSLRSSK